MNDEEPDLEGLYSDENDTDSEIGNDDFEQDDMDVEMKPAKLTKKFKPKAKSAQFDTEVLGEMLDNTDRSEAIKKQQKWEAGRARSNDMLKRKTKGTGKHPNKRRKFTKKRK